MSSKLGFNKSESTVDDNIIDDDNNTNNNTNNLVIPLQQIKFNSQAQVSEMNKEIGLANNLIQEYHSRIEELEAMVAAEKKMIQAMIHTEDKKRYRLTSLIKKDHDFKNNALLVQLMDVFDKNYNISELVFTYVCSPVWCQEHLQWYYCGSCLDCLLVPLKPFNYVLNGPLKHCWLNLSTYLRAGRYDVTHDEPKNYNNKTGQIYPCYQFLEFVDLEFYKFCVKNWANYHVEELQRICIPESHPSRIIGFKILYGVFSVINLQELTQADLDISTVK